MTCMETYRTLRGPVDSEVYKVKGSKFMAFAFPVESREEIETILLRIRENHRKANHCCYAWKIGTENPEVRFNDDGEPTNSAGKPIYGQILSVDLTNVLVVVVRYFGGTKLGMGGLIQAYRESSRQALADARVVEKQITLSFLLHFDYAEMDRVMRLVKETSAEITGQDMEMDVRLRVRVSKKNESAFTDQLSSMRGIKLTVLS